jgi:pSer/pThr/pTyr-binding forkhead associated (FHA) protein
MRVNCPRCGAKLDLLDENFANQGRVQMRCWMCTSIVSIDSPSTESGPPTITVAPQKKSKASIMGALKLQTTTLALPRDKIIKISVIAGPSQGAECELSRPLTTIGRMGRNADIKLDDPEVSGMHCAIEVRRDAILLHDLNSRNGTYIDRFRVVAARLEPASQFRIGSSVLHVSVIPKTNETRESPAETPGAI